MLLRLVEKIAKASTNRSMQLKTDIFQASNWEIVLRYPVAPGGITEYVG